MPSIPALGRQRPQPSVIFVVGSRIVRAVKGGSVLKQEIQYLGMFANSVLEKSVQELDSIHFHYPQFPSVLSTS